MESKDNKVFWNRVYGSYKMNAEKRQIEFKLTFEDVVDICSKPCFYCNSAPKLTSRSNGKNKKRDVGVRNGIDRFDNKSGYIITNVVACCKSCNSAKSILSGNEFIDLCQKVASYHLVEKCVE